MTETITLEIEGKRVQVGKEFLSLSPEQQSATVDEIATSMNITPSSVMGQLNEGIASTAGGVVDFLNPFDNPVWGEIAGGKLQTGSVAEGLRQGMEYIGADVSRGAPQNVGQAMARGVGNAAAALPFGGLVTKGLSTAGGLLGSIADDAYNALASAPGMLAELTAGGISGGAQETAREAGAPQWVQDTAAIAAPMAIPAAIAATRGAASAVQKLPLTGAAIRMGKDIVRGFAPMTETGAREVVKDRVFGLLGGEDRAADVGRMIDPNDPLNRTPAQQTGDPNLLGLERSAMEESPLARDRIAERLGASRETAATQIAGMGGEVKDAKTFFDSRFKIFKDGMQARVDGLVKSADDAVEARGPRNSETANSAAVVARIRNALDEELMKERDLWAAVPKDARVSTAKTSAKVNALIEDTAWAQRRDIPEDLRAAFGENGALGKATTVKELHGLYSEMRRVARSAMAGTNQNKNLARVSNEVAKAILDDLGAVGGESPAGRAINTARAFSAGLHETFDQGAVGRMLQRTIDGDEAIAPEAALARTVGRGGAQATVDAEGIEKAAPKAKEQISDYLRGRFVDSVFAADGTFSPKAAEGFLRQNRELLGRYPSVMNEFRKALSSRQAAEAFAARSETRMKLAERNSPAVGFTDGQDQNAVLSIISADDPAKAARGIVATARKDTSGKALAGVKGAFSDYLIGKAGTADGLSGARLGTLVKDPNVYLAMRQVFTPEELTRLQRIAIDLSRMEAPAANIGPVMDSQANKLLEYVVRIVAAQKGGQLGGGTMGGSLQTANIASSRAQALLRNLTNDKARKLLMDAIEDPALFKALLIEPRAFALSTEARNKIAPYLVGTIAGGADQPQQED